MMFSGARESVGERLRLLQQEAQEAGVEMEFAHPVTALATLAPSIVTPTYC